MNSKQKPTRKKNKIHRALRFHQAMWDAVGCHCKRRCQSRTAYIEWAVQQQLDRDSQGPGHHGGVAC